jgi:hypothetical protein
VSEWKCAEERIDDPAKDDFPPMEETMGSGGKHPFPTNRKRSLSDESKFPCSSALEYDAPPITIPGSASFIPKLCFSDCAFFGNVSFAANSKLLRFGAESFAHTALEGIHIRASVEVICALTFDAGSRLQ